MTYLSGKIDVLVSHYHYLLRIEELFNHLKSLVTTVDIPSSLSAEPPSKNVCMGRLMFEFIVNTEEIDGLEFENAIIKSIRNQALAEQAFVGEAPVPSPDLTDGSS